VKGTQIVLDDHAQDIWKIGQSTGEANRRGYRFVNLGNQSCFNGIGPRRLRIAIASHKNMYKHH
jgi:hypothetical protein